MDQKYTTTMHALVSAVTKLALSAKVPSQRKVYRGLGGLPLNSKFFQPDARNTRGGVEFSFLSTSLDYTVALQYSGKDKNRGIVFEIEVGKIDCGAQLGSISQYHGEREVLFPPLCNLEVVGKSRLEASDGHMILVVPVKINLNLKGRTIQQMIENRKEQVVQMTRRCIMEFISQLRKRRDESEADRYLQELSKVQSNPTESHATDNEWMDLIRFKLEKEREQPEWFNQDSNFRECWNQLLLKKNRCMSKFFGVEWMDELVKSSRDTRERFWSVLKGLRLKYTPDVIDDLATKYLSEHSSVRSGEEDPVHAFFRILGSTASLIFSSVTNPIKTTNLVLLNASQFPLSQCTISRRVEELRIMFAAGMDKDEKINQCEPVYGNSALHWACYYGKEDMVEELLYAKANINARNKVMSWKPSAL